MALSNRSDATLLAFFRSGDESALEAICARYETALFPFLVGILRDHHLAEDALQETFVRALEKLDGGDAEHLRGWLFTVAYHQAMLTRRRQKGRPVPLLPPGDAYADPAAGPLLLAEARDDARRLRDLLERLPSAQREVIRQRVYEGKRFREIAEDLHCPLNTALARMHGGLKRLRRLWDSEQHAPAGAVD